MTPKEEVEKMARDHIPLSEIWLVPVALAVARYVERRALERAAHLSWESDAPWNKIAALPSEYE